MEQPKQPQPESAAEKQLRLKLILKEAAAAYQENNEKGEVAIGFLTDSGDMWYMPGKVAEVTDTEVIWAEGGTFPLQYVEEVERPDGD